jgi:hypothetical protein
MSGGGARDGRWREHISATLPRPMEVQCVAESPDPTETFSEPMQGHWNVSNERLRAVFTDNPFGLACDVCDRLWFAKDLKKVKVRHVRLLETTFPGEEVPRTPKWNAVSFKPSCNTPTTSRESFPITSLTPTFRAS